MSTQLILRRASEGTLSEIPAHLREDAGHGLELARKTMRPGRLKVVQQNKTDKYVAFDEGDLIITPSLIKVASAGEPWYFVPLYFYMEWATTNPYALKSSLPMIRPGSRTSDPRSLVARKANDKELRSEKCPENEKHFIRHVEYLNFIVAIVANPTVPVVPVVLPFCRGEHGRGSALRDLLAMRAERMGICANILQGVVPETKRVNDQGQWYGIDVGPPTGEDAPPPFVMDPGEYAELKKMSDAIKEAHQGAQLDVDLEAEESDRADESAESAKF